MQWTIRWFRNQVDVWSGRSKRDDGDLPLGHKSYATKQQKLWKEFEMKATARFGLYLPAVFS